MGEFDVLVGINLLREGLDLPEVSLVAILDADKEGFLRSGTSLIQTIGRAARNVSGQVHMYADKITPSMRSAIDETNRRRDKQIAYNTARRHRPAAAAQEDRRHPRRRLPRGRGHRQRGRRHGRAARHGGGGRRMRAGSPRCPAGRRHRPRGARRPAAGMPRAELADLIQQLNDQMLAAARELQFELAARLRDEISELKKELRGMDAAGVGTAGVHKDPRT